MNMRRLAIANLRANPTRFIATLLAIVVGTGFLAGALVLRDSLDSTLKANIDTSLAGVDASIEPRFSTVAAGSEEIPTSSTGPSTDSSSVVPGTGSTPRATTSTSIRRSSTTVAGGAGRGGRRGGRGGGGNGVGEVRSGVPSGVLDEVRGLPGVNGAAGNLAWPVNILGPDSKPVRSNSIGRLWVDGPELSPLVIISGAAPLQPGQIAVDQQTLEDANATLGSTVTLATATGPRASVIVGVAAPKGRTSAIGGGTISIAPPDGFALLGEGKAQYDSIFVGAAPGTSEAALVATIQAQTGNAYVVSSGTQLRDDQQGQAGSIASILGNGLQGFAYLALFVGLFIIYNTFSIVVAQRIREFALLRAIGASSKQIRRAVLVEAVVVGFVASAIGFVTGIGLFLLLVKAIPQFKAIAGDVGLQITLGSVIQVLISGTVITLLSVLFPMFRAGRTKPIEALRVVAIDRSGSSRVRAIIGLVLLGIGGAFLLAGSASSNYLVMMVGPPALFLGVLVGGPVLAGAFAAGVAKVLAPLGRPTLKLGVENLRRNPRRAATTANALVIGVFLVVLVTAGGGAVRDFAVDKLSQFGGSDFTVSGISGALPEGFGGKVKELPGVADAAPVYVNVGAMPGVVGPFGGGVSTVGAIDFTQVSTLGLTAKQGSFDGLRPNQLIVAQSIAQQNDLKIGSPVDVTMNNGAAVKATVGAISATSISFVDVYMDAGTALAAAPGLEPTQIAVSVQSGQQANVARDLEKLSSGYTSILVLPGNFLGALVKDIFNFLISSTNALLSVAVLIALFGIVNTLILSITERTHEIGLLRSVGMSRRQLRSTIALEALIVSLLGSLLGMVSGLFVAWCLTRPIFTSPESGGGSFSWPVSQMSAVLALGVILGIAASIIPAWRSGRIDILDAISTE